MVRRLKQKRGDVPSRTFVGARAVTSKQNDDHARIRVAYVVHHDVGQTNGVVRKFAAQMRAWKEMRVEVCLFAATPSGRVTSLLDDLAVEAFPRTEGRFRQVRRLSDAVGKWQPDLIYLRFGTYYWSLARLMRRTPTVLELNTNDIEEYRVSLSPLKYLYHRLFRGRMITAADAAVAVTSEVAKGCDLPTTVIANGISLADYQVLQPVHTDRLRGVFMGSPGLEWHGVDKVMQAAGELSQWHFDIIGCEMEPGIPAPSNMTWHGLLGRKEYEKVIAQADVAFGTLALHRKGMNCACPLKVREYLAFGLPVVIGYSDEDFPMPEDFLLQLPNTEANVVTHLGEIDEFGRSWRGRRVPRPAVEQIDVGHKERARVELFKSVLGAGKRTGMRAAQQSRF